MPVLNVEQNIEKLTNELEKLHQEIYRLQGSLRVFLGFKEAGLEEIDVPEKAVEQAVDITQVSGSP
jgi:lipid II:glycine glycyltransferase (peptidoglycan interpeptide bridge formation enzyme)